MLSQPAGIDHKYHVDRSHEEQNLQILFTVLFCISSGYRLKTMETVNYCERKNLCINMYFEITYSLVQHTYSVMYCYSIENTQREH